MPARYLPSGFGVPALLAPLHAALAEVGSAPMTPVRVAIALSGGADSAMLAVHAALVARQIPFVQLHCFHIHHGLQAVADEWQAHVHCLAGGLGIPCHSRRVQVEHRSGKGEEAAARDARYAGIKHLADAVGVTHILLAHHRDDQAETVLMRLLRGSGPTGLAAMNPVTHRDGLVYLRPWLDLDRNAIVAASQDYSASTGWEAVTDPTNTSEVYTRGAVRSRLVPVLNERWPAWRAILSRHAKQAADTAALLHEVAEADFAGLQPDDDRRSFSLAAWRALTPERQVLVLRHWLAMHKLRAPTDARMRELCRQLRSLHALGHDRSMRLRHEGHWVSCERGWVKLSYSNDSAETR